MTFDPAAPTPTLGGRLLSSAAGYKEDSALSRRPDVVDFTGAPPVVTPLPSPHPPS